MSDLQPGTAPIQLLTQELLALLRVRAHSSPRLRTNHNFHARPQDNPHRFLNVMCRGTYITPHRHLDPPKSESFLVLAGRIAFVIFDDTGNLEKVTELGPEGYAFGIDIAPGIWHTLVVLSEDAVCYEVKPGPYSPASDKEFAAWAPQEGSPDCARYLSELSRRISGDLGTPGVGIGSESGAP